MSEGICSDIAIKADQLSKCHHIYDKPGDRLRQMLLPRGKPHYREFWALKNVSFDIRRGETVGIIGRNGSGKSTLLQLICGVANATSGTVHQQGRVAALLELGSGFNPEFTGRENVYLNGAILGLTQAEIDARFDEIADFANIGDFIDQPTKVYSSGMLVRLAFAVSVCVEPDILIVDEALAVGDASFQFKCLNRLEALAQQGTTLLFVSHDMSMVKRFCSRVLYMRAGEVRASGPADEMAELYLLDMRDEQRRWSSGGAVSVTPKPFLGTSNGMAFGTDEGQIVSATFASTGELFSSFAYGESIDVCIETRVRESVQLPSISLTVQEARLLVVGGINLPLTKGPAEDGWCQAAITLRFPASLAVGRYHITLKLMNGYTEDTAQLIEKQVAALAFDTLPGSKSFLGIVDLGIEPVHSSTQGHPVVLDPVKQSMSTRVTGPVVTRTDITAMNDQEWQIAIFGTFDVANYGDLLFPIIAEAELTRRLGPVKLHRFSYHAKSASHWPYEVTSLTELAHVAGKLDAVLIGGGFIVRFDKFVARDYAPPTADIHHPTGYWLTPGLIALQHGIPLIWNAPGMHCNDVPGWAAPLLKLTLEQSPHIRVRDALSQATLASLSDTAQIEVLPDTAFGLPRLIDDGQPSAQFLDLCETAGLTGQYLVVHAIAGGDSFLRLWRTHAQLFPELQLLLLPIGPVLGDHESILGDDLPRSVRLPIWPHPLLLAELIAHSQGVVGHSYHLAITALSFGVPVFCTADLTAGKYTSLPAYQRIFQLYWHVDIDPLWFRSQLGKQSTSAATRQALVELDAHWDRIAEITRQGRRATSPALNRFWQTLPGLLESAQETPLPEQLAAIDHANAVLAQQQDQLVQTQRENDALAERLADALRLHQQTQAQLQANEQAHASAREVLNDALALCEAQLSTLYRSNSFKLTAWLRAIRRGLRHRPGKQLDHD
ncbi:MAG: tagH [Pseudomonas sp.]|nr:tagH [Pseudomonas sp.]